ncbi:MAG: site-2 protease family protein [Planctomycetaceae bacterium]|nr:site-2 protease family protein [Planctomycetaceae bacterium]
MGGSWRIGTVSGIGIFLHWTFLILLGWIGVSHILRGDGLGDALQGIIMIVALFGVVVLHELGHALAARRYGIPTKDITLLPIGGVARLERMPEEPREELVVALAGPSVNVVLAILCAVGIMVFAGTTNVATSINTGMNELEVLMENQQQLGTLSEPLVGFLTFMLIANVILVVFNLLPAFPMDGGRVLRAILAMNMDYVRATQTAATIGKGMAVLIGFWGLFSMNPFPVFIALFVWLGAASEASMVQVKSGLQGIPVAQAMVSEFRTLAPEDPLGEAARHIIAGFQHDFPVVAEGRIVGVLTKMDLLKHMAEQGPGEQVGTVMRRDFEQADPGDMLDTVFARLQGCDCHAIPVVRQGNLVGMLTMENVGEYLAIRSALSARRI